MFQRSRIIAVATLTAALVVLGGAWRGYRELVPAGATWRGPVLSIGGWVEGPAIVSPHGRSNLAVAYWDGGATHSGPFWTRVMSHHWLFGFRVIAEGYTAPEVALGGKPFPARWLDSHTVELKFLTVDDSEIKVIRVAM